MGKRARSPYVCAECHKQGVRLYRVYGNFLRKNEIFCNEHIPVPMLGRQWWVPLIPDVDNTVWGTFSVPAEARAAWEALPDAQVPGPVWKKYGWEENDGY